MSGLSGQGQHFRPSSQFGSLGLIASVSLSLSVVSLCRSLRRPKAMHTNRVLE